VLGGTSTDAAIKRLGTVRWNRLHAIVYGLAVLSLVHFFIQSRLDVTQPVLMSGFFVWLMGYRLLRKRDVAINLLSLSALALTAGLATALIEVAWYASMTGVKASRVLAANLDFSFVIRPAWWVLWAGLALALVQLARRPANPAARR
jgi:methionine sulfoxide reductase heme-binding subunit